MDISIKQPMSDIHTWIYRWIYPWIYPWISISTATLFIAAFYRLVCTALVINVPRISHGRAAT